MSTFIIALYVQIIKLNLHPVVCRRAHVLLCFLCMLAYSGDQHLCCDVLVCRRLMSNLRYSCLFAYSGVQHILCCVFVLFFFALYPYVASLSGLSIFIYNWIQVVNKLKWTPNIWWSLEEYIKLITFNLYKTKQQTRDACYEIPANFKGR